MLYTSIPFAKHTTIQGRFSIRQVYTMFVPCIYVFPSGGLLKKLNKKAAPYGQCH